MIERIIEESVGPEWRYAPGWVPAEHVSRDAWQAIAEDVIGRLRLLTGRAAFGVGEAELSVLYHRPVADFARLVLERLGV